MKNFLFLLALITAGAAFGQTTYGDKATADGAIPASSIAAKMKGLDSLEVKVIGTVVNVCQKQGCWLQVDIGDGKMMRVRFKDHAFFVPKNISGKTVVLDGYVYSSATSVAELRHYAQDAGKSEAEIKKIAEPEVSLNYEARSVIVM
ncbi:MAG: DUF4920 domain-containing protein [Gallionellaceae bacterium]|jgi:hypothetical protein|nr:DUF4920 domain-containing protein [Gallionellaceae bacterium]